MAVNVASETGYDRLSCEVRVIRSDGSVIKFFQCVSIEIDTSMDTLTDVATVTLPYDNR
ncbi:hypothetical protein ACFSC6_11060 [Rufibacter sediminis]|uniref:Uncharacterized protein n=1 Tax=Rufibacter sediminis TaxID=2762756 RepID=A0ABR6VU26_9BACT|nr:hypothetical protein [Rufibacter sediminis]MBC3540420.1 hypothetical protein [Rufibacter sediminis]